MLQRKAFAEKVNTHAVQQLGEILPVLQPVQRSKPRAITEVCDDQCNYALIVIGCLFRICG